MARLYSDEDFYLPVVVALRELGHDVLTVSESGRANQEIPDEEVLAFAIEHERIVITFNRRHFIKLHQLDPHHAGIIVCTVDEDIEALARRIDTELRKTPDLTNQLIRIRKPQAIP